MEGWGDTPIMWHRRRCPNISGFPITSRLHQSRPGGDGGMESHTDNVAPTAVPKYQWLSHHLTTLHTGIEHRAQQQASPKGMYAFGAPRLLGAGLAKTC